ncbi:MAG: DUF4834 family protein [Cyclobacteriaceae bacterium]
MGLIKLLFVCYLIYWLVIKVGGSLMRTLFGTQTNNNQQRSSNQRGYSSSNRKEKEGTIRINKKRDNKTPLDDFKGGEYVDYEEVD